MNRLHAETSPYLLQHRDNPVHWHAWNDEAWRIAKSENKPVLISIGYSACHWCHVMEHEVFEDFECAELMNMNFVCIKVDREERPDIDSWFMDAAHLMGSRGGWPLNVFTLPDGKPIFAGTYFPKQNWIVLLENLKNVFHGDFGRVEEYGSQVSDALRQLNGPRDAAKQLASIDAVHSWVADWSQHWDTELGGNRKAPKFPMPTNWELLLQYAVYFNDEHSAMQVRTTLTKMALGGIYDQLAGGFARYSVDAEWKVPHFEKMLYDNAQLVSVYAQAFRAMGDDLFLRIVDETVDFMKREWRSIDGLYYAALDADTEGMEGKYYVWNESEFDAVLGDDSAFIKKYYGVGTHGYWEHGNSVLCIHQHDQYRYRALNSEEEKTKALIASCNKLLLQHRNKRAKPGLDDKCVASWNGMLVRAFAEASRIKQRSHYLKDAEQLLEIMIAELMQENGLLAHAKTKGKLTHVYLLEDQVSFMEALLLVYETGGEEKWLRLAEEMMIRVEKHFNSTESSWFLNRAQDAQQVAGAKFEINDNVIPAANSIACRILIKLARHCNHTNWQKRAESMLLEIVPSVDYAPGYSNWILGLLEVITEPVEIAFTGPAAIENSRIYHEKLHPFVVTAASTCESELPLFKARNSAESLIYVCRNNTCDKPLHKIEEILND